MTTYIITYDLKAPGRNYEPLYEAIRGYGTRCKLTESTWAVVTNQSATDVHNNLAKHVDSNDVLFVARVGAPGAWRCLSEATTAWLRKHLN